MRTVISKRRIGTLALVGVLGTLLLALVPDVSGQDAAKLRSVVKEGYTRPGNPSDEITPTGEIKPVALTGEIKGFGGTIYFVVLKLSGDEGDVWNTGITNFDRSFIPGNDFIDNYSPTLDTRSKYLYLYQVVNDRGIEKKPGEIKGAALEAPINAGPLEKVMVPLLVDPRYITSWGHFKQQGFTVEVDEPKAGEVVPAGGKPAMEEKILAVSANPAVIEELPQKAYRIDAPAYKLRNLIGVGKATTGLKESTAIKQISDEKGVKPVANWAQGLLESAQAAHEPDFVQISFVDIRESYGDDELLLKSGFELSKKYLVFRADWLNDNAIPLGKHSVLFGFTTDLPPTDVKSVLGGLVREKEGAPEIAPAGIVPAAAAQGGLPSPSVGTLPTPVPPAPAAAAAAGMGGAGGGLGGLVGAGGGLGGLGGAAIPAGIGGFGGATTGGGGGGIGGGGGEQQQPQQENQQQEQQQPVNITINNVNQQQQQQKQQQQQQQQQKQQQQQQQEQFIIPEPGTIILGMLGLPGLYYVCRRRRAKTAVDQT